MRKFRISVGRSRLSTRLTKKQIKWDTLAARLVKYETVDMSYREYLSLDRETQSSHKDVGYFIGGQFNSTSRLLEKMATRCCITLDIDHLDSWDMEAIQDAYHEYEYVVHSTLKHSADSPRLRLVFPLAHDITPDKYEPVSRKLANMLGMDCFDDTTFQPARIMFWPAVTVDGDVWTHHNTGEFVDVKAILGLYEDWQDFSTWPHSSRVNTVHKSDVQAENPLTKRGIIGAFNRTFDIHAAITRFNLPYTPTEHDNRYRPHNATGPSGAVVYDDVFLFSHHESDAVGMQNVNAWDLVRINLFGELDNDIDKDEVSVMRWPSSKQMSALAGSLEPVQKELRTPADEMEALEVEPKDEKVVSGEVPTKKPKVDSSADALTFQSLLVKINTFEPEEDYDLMEQCQAMIPRIAAAKLDPQEIGILAGVLNKKYPKPHPGKVALERSIIIASKRLTAKLSDKDGSVVDMERELISAALDEHYDGGKTLKRIGRKCWSFKEGLWSMVEDEPVRGRVGKTYTRLREERPDDMMQLVATVGEGKTSALVKSIWGLLCDDLAVQSDNEDPLQLQRSFALPVINCRNCEIHMDKEGNVDVRPHNPDHFYTIRIDTDYDPDAKCPEWDRFMQMVFSNGCDPEDMVRHFEELGGYIVQFSRWLKTWVLFHGETDTGKSTAAMVFQQMLGSAYTGKSMAKLSDERSQFNEAGLIGKLLMVDDDFAYDGHLPDGFLKTYSEEKPVTAAIKYGSDLNFKARSLPLILSNHYPVTRDTTSAFLERALVIPFTYRIKGREKDDQRRARMMGEFPGILNKFLAGLVRLRKRGSWDRPMDVLEAQHIWKTKSNPAMQFLSECVVKGGGSRSRIKRVTLYEIYSQWNQEQTSQGGRQYVMKKGQFYERMRAQLGKETKSNGIMYFTNVSVSPGFTEEMEKYSHEWD